MAENTFALQNSHFENVKQIWIYFKCTLKK